MKKVVLLAITCAVLLLASHAAQAAQSVTVYGDDSYTPYSFSNRGQPDGIYVKIFQTAFKRMDGYNVTIELVPWKRAMKLIEKGQGFAAFPPYYRPEQRPWIQPWSDPILEEGFAVYCRAEVLTSPRPNWPDDYKDLTIGINAGFSVPDTEGLKIEEAADNEANLKKLKAGRIDAYVNDDASIRYTMSQMGISSDVIKKGTQINTENGYLAFSRDFDAPYKQDFVAKFNAAIKAMQDSGEIDRIVASFLNQ
ncbi:ABC transporter substrate-binding protein [Desulfobaculum senezii]|jgi:polar amino acid transport system substrate-binding protein